MALDTLNSVGSTIKNVPFYDKYISKDENGLKDDLIGVLKKIKNSSINGVFKLTGEQEQTLNKALEILEGSKYAAIKLNDYPEFKGLAEIIRSYVISSAAKPPLFPENGPDKFYGQGSIFPILNSYITLPFISAKDKEVIAWFEKELGYAEKAGDTDNDNIPDPEEFKQIAETIVPKSQREIMSDEDKLNALLKYFRTKGYSYDWPEYESIVEPYRDHIPRHVYAPAETERFKTGVCGEYAELAMLLAEEIGLKKAQVVSVELRTSKSKAEKVRSVLMEYRSQLKYLTILFNGRVFTHANYQRYCDAYISDLNEVRKQLTSLRSSAKEQYNEIFARYKKEKRPQCCYDDLNNRYTTIMSDLDNASETIDKYSEVIEKYITTAPAGDQKKEEIIQNALSGVQDLLKKTEASLLHSTGMSFIEAVPHKKHHEHYPIIIIIPDIPDPIAYDNNKIIIPKPPVNLNLTLLMGHALNCAEINGKTVYFDVTGGKSSTYTEEEVNAEFWDVRKGDSLLDISASKYFSYFHFPSSPSPRP